MLFGCCLRYGKPEAVMPVFAAARFVHTIKAVKKVLQLVLRDFVTVVDYSQYSCVPLAFQGNSDFTACRIPDRIVQQD